MTGAPDDQLQEIKCDQCGHDFDDHAVIAPTGDPLDGGIILCPVQGCQCFSTWSPKHPAIPEVEVVVPDRAMIEQWRDMLQGSD